MVQAAHQNGYYPMNGSVGKVEQPTMLNAALDYLGRGWSVLPLCPPDHAGMSHQHSEGCASPGKRPFISWQRYQEQRATVEEIRRWWEQHPNANVGIALGPVSGLIRVDVEGHAGEQALIAKSQGDLPPTLEFRSGRQDGTGRGLLYKIPAGAALKTTTRSLGEKSELRFQAKGAQTVLPPSQHVSGGMYAWKPGHGPTEMEAAMAPAWLLRELAPKEQPPPSPDRNGHGPLHPYVKAALDAELGKVAIAKEGSRNDTLNKAAHALGQFIAGDVLDRHLVEAELTLAAQRSGLAEKEIAATIRSGLEAGMKQPRGVPESRYRSKIAARTQGPDVDGCAQDRLQNFVLIEVQEDQKPKMVREGISVGDIRDDLLAMTDGWPKRVGNLLFAAKNQRPIFLQGTSSLFAWIGAVTGQTPLWAEGQDKPSKCEFYSHLIQSGDEYAAVEGMPHYPPLVNHFYLHDEVKGGDGHAIRQFLDRFNPATNVDRDLMLAAILTPAWGGPPGQRPAFLMESEDGEPEGGRGVGKTKFAQAVSYLYGGHIDARPQEDFDKLMKRLLSPSALDRRVALLDNVKLLRFSWSDLEGLITSDIISGYQLYTGEGRRPNTLTWFITLNNASLSKDMAQRCLIIKVKRPPHDPSWEQDTWSLIEEKRWEIIGDALAELKRPPGRLTRYSRWSAWEAAVLSKVDEPAECQKVAKERQSAVDGDQEDSDLIREAFISELRSRGHTPEKDSLFIPSAMAAQIYNNATGQKLWVNKATGLLRLHTIKELRKSDRATKRGFAWQGEGSDATVPLSELNPATVVYP